MKANAACIASKRLTSMKASSAAFVAAEKPRCGGGCNKHSGSIVFANNVNEAPCENGCCGCCMLREAEKALMRRVRQLEAELFSIAIMKGPIKRSGAKARTSNQ